MVPMIESLQSLSSGLSSFTSLDASIDFVWTACKDSAWFRHDSWEPGLVSVAWFVCTAFWYILDNYVPQAKRYRISSSDDFDHWTMEGARWKQEVILYVLPLLVFDWLYPRRALPDAAPTAAVLAADVFLSLFFYDLFFTICHFAMHQSPRVYQALHAKHHANKVQRATEAIRVTVVEQVLDVGSSIAAVNICNAHPLSRTVYNIIIVWLIIELHSGYDFPWMLQNIVPLGIWGGSRRHDVHHQNPKVHYQKFFTYFDDAFGFVLPPNKAPVRRQ